MFFDFRERKRGRMRERRRETDIDVSEKHLSVGSWTYPDRGSILQPSYVPQQGIKPPTFLVYRTALQPTEPSGQGYKLMFWVVSL